MNQVDQWNRLAAGRSYDRREFLRGLCGSALATTVSSVLPRRAWGSAVKRRKVVVVTFGGGARDEETFAPEGQQNIPRMLQELMPQAAFFTQVVNRGILGHYVATASLATGVYERFNNFADVSPENPTLFEYFRQSLKRPASDAWVVAPSNGFNRIGQSSHGLYTGAGASVILPKRLLAHADGSAAFGGLEHLLNDNYESPIQAPVALASEMPSEQVASMLKLSVADFAAHASTLNSPDELSLFVARRIMREVAPCLLWVTLHDIDVAHTGAFSLYLEGIRRSDTICAELWRTIQSEPEYKDQTNLLILPDFGRDSDGDAGGNGFQHHRTGDALSRTTWMMALGPDVRQNTVVDRPIESIDLTPTVAALFGCDARMSQGHLIRELGL
ncbi:hypothetical protein [Granulicella sp. dw_53]|uniref:hypothetical protein n=1 Tax=Granulicella sp. dw_53 TaxID=2719792 RepID=UPI001C49DCAC|nr:hypothetical protein [Granulicella sp. dw_53]